MLVFNRVTKTNGILCEINSWYLNGSTCKTVVQVRAEVELTREVNIRFHCYIPFSTSTKDREKFFIFDCCIVSPGKLPSCVFEPSLR